MPDFRPGDSPGLDEKRETLPTGSVLPPGQPWRGESTGDGDDRRRSPQVRPPSASHSVAQRTRSAPFSSPNLRLI